MIWAFEIEEDTDADSEGESIYSTSKLIALQGMHATNSVGENFLRVRMQQAH